MKEKLTVIGGAGFIGSHICNKLKDDYDILAVDNFSVGNIKNLDADINVLEASVHDWHMRALEKVFKNSKYVLWQAGASCAVQYETDPVGATTSTYTAFMKTLECCRKLKIPLIYASSSSIYGELPPLHYEGQIGKPLSLYSEVKIAMERAAQIYSSFYGLPTIGLRYFSVYGPNEKYKKTFANVVHQFLWMMMKGERPDIYGDGTQARDYIYVDDVVNANVLAMEKIDFIFDREIFPVFNVGTGIATTYNDAVKKLNEHLGTNIEPLYVENPLKNYVSKTQANTISAKIILNFKHSISLDEGIEKLIDFENKAI